MWHPSSWTAETVDGATTFTAPDESGVLTVTPIWLKREPLKIEAGAEALASVRLSPGIAEIADPNRMFPAHRRVRSLQALEVGQQSIGFEGEAAFTGGNHWWQKLWPRRAWRKFRVWCVRHENVHLLALFMQSGQGDPEAATIASMILNTLDFPDEPALPPEQFVDRAVELARQRFPKLKCAASGRLQLTVGVFDIDLEQSYRAYVQAPDEFESILVPVLTTVMEADDDLEHVRDRVMPLLCSEQVWRERFPQFIADPWTSDLVVMYVVDESHAYWFIREELTEQWGLDVDELRELAVENLEQYYEDEPMELTVAEAEEGPRLLIPSRPDVYNSARLLSPKFQASLRGVLGREFVVGLPSRDLFVALSLECPETVSHIRTRVASDFQQMEHPLSDRLLLVTHDGVTEYLPWA